MITGIAIFDVSVYSMLKDLGISFIEVFIDKENSLLEQIYLGQLGLNLVVAIYFNKILLMTLLVTKHGEKI